MNSDVFDWRAFLCGIAVICAAFAEWHALDLIFKP